MLSLSPLELTFQLSCSQGPSLPVGKLHALVQRLAQDAFCDSGQADLQVMPMASSSRPALCTPCLLFVQHNKSLYKPAPYLSLLQEDKGLPAGSVIVLDPDLFHIQDSIHLLEGRHLWV